MRLIVDTNIIFAALIRDSHTRYILFHVQAELFTVGFTYIELQKYKDEILRKSNATPEIIDIFFNKIMKRITIIDDTLIKTKFREAHKIMETIDIKDTPFLAAALATDADIWSDDKHFERQNKVKVWKTRDIFQFYTNSTIKDMNLLRK